MCEEGLELRVLRVGDEQLVERVEDGLVVGDLVGDVGLVELSDLAVSSSSGAACLFTAEWSVTMRCASSFTLGLGALAQRLVGGVDVDRVRAASCPWRTRVRRRAARLAA